MKERPILMAGAMVRAALEGRKTQTRRPITLREFQSSGTTGYDWTFRDKHMRWNDYRSGDLLAKRCPFGVVGDRLWVRETWMDRNPIYIDAVGKITRHTQDVRFVRYAASAPERDSGTWRPSIHMPRWASRLTLEITGVRVERLQDIGEADARAEGVSARAPRSYSTATALTNDGLSAAQMFERLWDSLYPKAPWSSTPWVWALTFQRIEGEPMPTKILNAAQDILAGAELGETVEAYELDLEEQGLLNAALEAEGWVNNQDHDEGSAALG